MHALTPTAIRELLGIREREAAKTLRMSRNTLRAYEIHPDLVKTPAKRWLLERYYTRLARLIAESKRDRERVDEGELDDVPPESMPALDVAA